jgi:Na+-driven multidrug efflux pump
MGVVVLASQYWGKRETEPIRKIISLGLLLSLIIGFVFFSASFAFPIGVIGLLTNEASVAAEGAAYLKITCWTYVAFAFSLSLSTLIIKISLNYSLIYGNFGMPEMGIKGAGWAALIARLIELSIILVYVLFIDKKLKIRLKQLFAFDFTYIKDFIRVSLPLVLSGALWGFAQTVQMAILGHMSATVIAANSVAMTVAGIFAAVGLSCASSASVTIGKTIGEKRLDMIKPYTVTLQWIFFFIGLISGALIFFLRYVIIDIYALSAETSTLTIKFLTVLSVTTIGTCYQYPTASGIIAGGGDTKYPAIVENLFTWLFVIPASALSAFVFKWPPLATFIWMKADQILKDIPNGIYCNRYKWVKELTKEYKP